MTPQEQAEASRQVILRIGAALAAGSDDMAARFHEGSRSLGNTGCGTKPGRAAFRANWQLALRAAFTERRYVTERFIAEGDRMSCRGHIEATQSMGFTEIATTGKRGTIACMEFRRIEDGRTKDNRVTVDFPQVLAQLGRGAFDGQEWETFDRGEAKPPRP